MALESLIKGLNREGVMVVIAALQPRLILRLRRADIRKREAKVLFARTLSDALEKARPNEKKFS